METILEHFENGHVSFANNDELLNFVQKLFHENEEKDTPLIMPVTYEQAIEYLLCYCDNWSVIKDNVQVI